MSYSPVEVRQASVFSTYLELTKPRIWSLLVFTSFAAMLVAAQFGGISIPVVLVAVGLISISLGAAGSEAITGYLERDIDSKMARTRMRPVPSGRISPPAKALYFGLALISVSIVLAGMINVWALALLVLGIFDNIVIYTLVTKRTTPTNIILGSFSGAVPVLFGWATIAGALTLLPILLAFLVIIWTPWHIWSLAFYFKDDYKKADVPMLPVVLGERSAVASIVGSGMLLVAFSVVVYLLGGLGFIYLIVSLAVGVPTILYSARFALSPSGVNSWKVFKFTGPYLLILFIALVLDAVLIR